jgi:3-methyladenine DNA glycosylase AlkD
MKQTQPLDIAAEHAGFVAGLEAARRVYRHAAQNDSYGSSGQPFYFVSAPELRAMTRAWLAAHRAAADLEIVALVDSLLGGPSHEEKVLAALVLQASGRARRVVGAERVERWLGRLAGWAQIDALCASCFQAAEMLADWPAWRGMIQRLSRSDDINQRRAALVLLVTPTRTSPDARFPALAFEVIGRLQAERPILITKAVSWLLRSMTARHGPEVAAYLEANAALPAVAVRETRIKLATGTKSGRSARPGAA